MDTKKRYDLIDVLRGLAIFQMFVFHFCFLMYEFRLGFVGFTQDPFWTTFRILIVSNFLSIVGISLRLSVEGGLNKKSFYRRMFQLLLYGAIVIGATYFYEPRRTVVFGILQFILVATFLGLIFTRWHWLNLVLGCSLVIIGITLKISFFNQNGFYWIGLTTQRPITFDYVPMLPWFGVVLIGIYVGEQILNNDKVSFFSRWQSQNIMTNTLALMGRHSLNLYMAHVPVFYVFIYLFWVKS